MPTATVRSHSDAWVAENSDHQNFGGGVRLWVRTVATGNARRSFLSFAKPFPHNDAVGIVSATLQLRLKDAWTGSQVVTARRVTETWKENRVNWANQPAVTTTNEATYTVSSGADGDEIDIDVTDIIQDVASGGDWFGLRLSLDTDNKRAFYASDSAIDAYHPRLEIEWGLPPYPPTDLEPSGEHVIGVATPVLTWRYPDTTQETTQSASQVQISTSTDFSSPAYDSGKTTNTYHRFNTAGATTIPDGVTRYWRVRTWDDSDRVSGWSDTAQFSRHSQGTITIVNPGISNTVDDLTPSIEWTFSGTQDRVHLQLVEVKANGTTEQKYEYTEQQNTATSLTIPRRKKHPIIQTGKDYRVRLKVWDTYDRVGLPNDKPYAFAQRDFTYVRDGTPNAVDTLTATINGPGVVLTWTRASTPDWFCLRAGGVEVIHRIEPTDTATGNPAEYSMTYWEAIPRKATTYEVEAVEVIAGHNVHSDGNPTVSKTTNPTGVHLIDDDADEYVRIVGTDDASLSIGESGTTYDLVGVRSPVRITDAIRGYEGSFNGLVKTAAERDTFLDLKGRDKELRVVIANLNFPVYLEEVTVNPTPIPGGEQHEAGMSFFQVDEFFDAED